MVTLLNTVIVFLLILMNGYFVATEFAIVKVRKSRIETLVVEGNKSAKYVLKVVKDLNSYLSACQLGITLASLGLGWIGEPTVSKMLMPLFNIFHIPEDAIQSISVAVGFVIITTLHIVLGELTPKSLAIINIEKIAMCTARPLVIFHKLTHPIIWAFDNSTKLVLKIFGVSGIEEQEIAHTNEEMKLLAKDSYNQGLIDKTELTLAYNVFDFSDKTVKEIMIPRTDMTCIFGDKSFDDIVAFTLDKHMTRYPVCKDSKDNIIGFIHIKDLYKKKIEAKDENIEDIIREIKFVPESMSISELFKMFQKEKIQMAIIIDEYGGTSGLITIEDILEEIVGEIQDEFDEDGNEIIETEDNNYIVDGKLPIDDVNELVGINIDSENIDTIGGWTYSKLLPYPKVNDKFAYNDYNFIVLKCDKKRVNKILIKKLSYE